MVVSTYKAPAKTQKPVQNFHKSMRFITIIANIFGLLPVTGNTSVKSLNFRWISLKVLYSLMLLIIAIYGGVVNTITILQKHISLYMLFVLSTYVTWLIVLVSYLRLAKKWPKFVKTWCAVDSSMQKIYNYPTDLNIRIKMTAVVLLTMTATTYIEILLHAQPMDETLFRGRLVKNYTVIEAVSLINVGVAKQIVLKIGLIFSYFTGVFNNIFIIVVSTALALRFRQITKRLQSNKGIEMHSLAFWTEIRTSYIRLCYLCQLINDDLSVQIFMCFACNALYILLHILYIIRFGTEANISSTAVIYTDLIFRIIRIIWTSLYAAWINDESKKPASILNSIPSADYNPAIQMLLEHIAFDTVALTGNNFFRCTRGLILYIAEGIITYALLLIQFSAIISRL